MNRRSATFLFGKDIESEVAREGIVRQLLGFDDSLLMTRVIFETGAVGYVHSHFYSQLNYVEGGAFDALVAGVERRLGAGDSVYIEPNVVRGVTCCEAGVLLDILKPTRKDLPEDRKHED